MTEPGRKTFLEIPEGNAPQLTDAAITGEDPAGTHVLRRTTWQSIRNLFVGATTAANDFIVGNGTVWQKKTLAETKTVLGLDAMTTVDGWVMVADTWTYVSANSFKVTGDKTGVIQIGDCIKCTQGGTVKQFNVVNSAYASPDTTFTVTAGSDFSLANATITSPYYSHIHPIGFPTYFNLTTPTWTTNGTAFTNQPTSNGKFWMIGRTVYINIGGQANATSGGTGIFTATFTTGQLPQPINTSAGNGTSYNVSTNKSGWIFWDTNSPNVVKMALSDATALFTNSQYFNATVIGAI